jgi:formylglycine-generating enzyme required for sulfatase activity
MVMIPPGRFQMGAPNSEKGYDSEEGPVHEVRIAYAFAVGKYLVTRGEWRQFVHATGHPKASYNRHDWESPGFEQDDTHPVVCIDWEEATAYTAWLSQRTGHHYRLLSEAEWEYTARAGTTAAYYWGPEVGHGHANCNGCGSQWDSRTTSPVGSFAPNLWGLYDMAGNVWSWTLDCKHNSYLGRPPTDGSAWEVNADCSRHMIRGGSWNGNSLSVRAARRAWPDSGENDNGFRVAFDDRPSKP